jgi:hypothetical protein
MNRIRNLQERMELHARTVEPSLMEFLIGEFVSYNPKTMLKLVYECEFCGCDPGDDGPHAKRNPSYQQVSQLLRLFYEDQILKD